MTSKYRPSSFPGNRLCVHLAVFRELPLGMALKKTVLKLLGAAKKKVEKVSARLSPAGISNAELLESLEGFTHVEEALRALRTERPPFLIQPMEAEKLASYIQAKLPHYEKEISREADRVCRHEMDLLGSGPVDLDDFTLSRGGEEACGYLPWHFDFKAGYKWNAKKFYNEIRVPYGKADIKVPRELSRFQHIPLLGQAYWLTGDVRYAREFLRQVDDWIDRNPPRFGVNWTCTMDVAIRVCNWVFGYYFFKDSGVFTDDFLIRLLKSLLSHGRFIAANLENKAITNNHYVADLVGLIYLGVCFPEFKEATRWRELGISELANEMQKQVYDDGMDFEASTCYHRLALELFFFPALLYRLNGIEPPRAFLARLKGMFDFVLHALEPDGRMPQVGDNDNGRLHILARRDVLDMTYLLTFAALFFTDSRYKIEEFGFAPEALWLFGPEARNRWHDLPGRSLDEVESRCFPDCGIYVMRRRSDLYVMVSCGPNGQSGEGGHCHNDKLSFELYIDGRSVIVDPGTYVYTSAPEWRNRFRSVASHNTVVVDKEEQNPFARSGIFSLEDITSAECLKWEPGPDMDIFVGEHSGYRRSDNPVVHARKLELDKNEKVLNITDRFSGEGEHLLEWNFILSPGGERTVSIESERLRFTREYAAYSPGYGELIDTARLTASIRVKLPAEFELRIRVAQPAASSTG